MTRSVEGVLRAVAPLVLVAVVAAGCAPTTPDQEPAASPSPPATGPFPPAVIGALQPAEAVIGEAEHFESHPAVQTIRTYNVVLAWASLTDDLEFAQFTQHVRQDLREVYEDRDGTYPYAPTGPMPLEVRSLTENPDGTTTVRTCERYWTQVGKDDGSIQESRMWIDGTRELTVAPLTSSERGELTALGLEAPDLRVRDDRELYGMPDCEATSAVVQVFENWREVAPVGSYSGTRPGFTDVFVVGEDEPRRREDMP